MDAHLWPRRFSSAQLFGVHLVQAQPLLSIRDRLHGGYDEIMLRYGHDDLQLHFFGCDTIICDHLCSMHTSNTHAITYICHNVYNSLSILEIKEPYYVCVIQMNMNAYGGLV